MLTTSHVLGIFRLHKTPKLVLFSTFYRKETVSVRGVARLPMLGSNFCAMLFTTPICLLVVLLHAGCSDSVSSMFTTFVSLTTLADWNKSPQSYFPALSFIKRKGIPAMLRPKDNRILSTFGNTLPPHSGQETKLGSMGGWLWAEKPGKCEF